MSQLFSLPVGTLSHKELLFQIKQHAGITKECIHIISLNPEHVMLAQKDELLREIIRERSIPINDGVGIELAARFLGIPVARRITGVDLMTELLTYAGEMGLSVLMVGSKNGVADKIADCYSKRYTEAKFHALEGYKNIKSPQNEEENELAKMIKRVKPNFVFVAFGAPWQEYWIDSHRNILQHSICMGIGGGFDYLSGDVVRAPQMMRLLGFEWLFRLLRQPWRVYRQFALIQFVLLVIREKLKRLS